MRIKQRYLTSVLCGLFLLSPALSFAGSFPCDQSTVCVTDLPKQVVKTPQNIQVKQNAAQKQGVDSLAYYLQELSLTPEQMTALYNIQQSQIPEVLKNMRNLEEAHSMLRKMAINNAYDQTVADTLTQKIVNHTANLAVLQAQREYEIFAMLNPAQVQRYEELVVHAD